MTWVPTEKEIQQVIAADGRHRYEYFIHRVCDARAVWALFNDGWASIDDEGGRKLIPLWPHAAYAQPLAVGPWADFQPRRIALADFLSDWVPGMREATLQPAVFPVPDGSSVIVSVDDLEQNLRTELSVVHGIDDD